MLELQPLPSRSPHPTPPLEGLSEGFLASFQSLTAPQRAYLIARAAAPSLAEAARQAEVKENTVYGWRSYIPAFKLCETQLLDAKGDSTLQLARALYKGAMPGVAMRQITQALKDDAGLSARELAAQQQARAAVAKGSGLETQEAPHDNVDELLGLLRALALKQMGQPQPPPQATTEQRVDRMLGPGKLP